MFSDCGVISVLKLFSVFYIVSHKNRATFISAITGMCGQILMILLLLRSEMSCMK